MDAISPPSGGPLSRFRMSNACCSSTGRVPLLNMYHLKTIKAEFITQTVLTKCTSGQGFNIHPTINNQQYSIFVCLRLAERVTHNMMIVMMIEIPMIIMTMTNQLAYFCSLWLSID